jgi:hypothetical protein
VHREQAPVTRGPDALAAADRQDQRLGLVARRQREEHRPVLARSGRDRLDRPAVDLEAQQIAAAGGDAHVDGLEGKGVGDTVEVSTPGGGKSYEIVGIRFAT